MTFSSAKVVCWPNFASKLLVINLMCILIICHSVLLTLKAFNKRKSEKLRYIIL